MTLSFYPAVKVMWLVAGINTVKLLDEKIVSLLPMHSLNTRTAIPMVNWAHAFTVQFIDVNNILLYRLLLSSQRPNWPPEQNLQCVLLGKYR